MFNPIEKFKSSILHLNRDWTLRVDPDSYVSHCLSVDGDI